VNKKMRSLPFLCYVWLLSGIIAHAQSAPSLRPPDQTFIYDFNGSVGAPAPAAPALNLGASYSIEFWMMIDSYPQFGQYVRVFDKGIPSTGDPFTGYELDLDPGSYQLSYSQTTGQSGQFSERPDRGGSGAWPVVPHRDRQR